MNMKKFLAFLLAACLMLGLCACGGETGEETKGTEGKPVESTAATQESTEATAAAPTYTVKVVDEGGNPIAGAMVQMCQGENCMPAVTDAQGVAGYNVPEDANYEVKFISLPAGYEYTTEETVFHFADGANEMTITLKAAA